MKELLEFLVKSIVSKPDEVTISGDEDGQSLEFSITTDPEDVGKVIGKNGQTIRAIRQIARMAAIKQNKFVNISLTNE